MPSIERVASGRWGWAGRVAGEDVGWSGSMGRDPTPGPAEDAPRSRGRDRRRVTRSAVGTTTMTLRETSWPYLPSAMTSTRTSSTLGRMPNRNATSGGCANWRMTRPPG